MNKKREKKSVFVEVFGDYPLIKVLDFFLDNYLFDYSKTQVAEGAGISFNTLNLFWDNLVKFKIIKKTREVGKSKMYKLNKKNPIVKKLVEIDRKLTLENLKKMKEPIKA